MRPRRRAFYAVAWLVLGLHAAVLTLAWEGARQRPPRPAEMEPAPPAVLLLRPAAVAPEMEPPRAARPRLSAPAPALDPALAPAPPPPATPQAAQPPATMAAPPPPTAEEWAFAARYTLKNSKGYRHAWGRQVRSLMGTATEGPEQGLVRLRVRIAPDGAVQDVQVLWSTSAVAERLALAAIERLPPLPPTPTGQPLVFEKTIAFSPFAGDDTPSYRDDCRSDPPPFRNPFAWDGRSPQVHAEVAAAPKPSPEELEECRKQLPPETVEAASASDQRQLDRWGWSTPRR